MSQESIARDKLLHRRWVTEGDRAALDELVKHQGGIVIKAATKYKSPKVSVEDRIGLGWQGVMEAVRTYDKSQAAFSTWAAMWAKAKILREIVEVSGHLTTRGDRKAFFRLRKAEQSVMGAGQEPTDAAVAQQIGGGVSAASVGRARAAQMYEQSLDAPLYQNYDGPAASLLDKLVDEASDHSARYAEQRAERDRAVALMAAIEALPERERLVMRRRWLDEAVGTLKQVGAEMGGLSRERVRQIEDKAMGKLRQALGAHDVSVYLEENDGRRSRRVSARAVLGSGRDTGRSESCRRMGCDGKVGRPCQICLRARDRRERNRAAQRCARSVP